MDIFGIETSCDETCAAVVRDGTEVLANIVSSQVELHRPYGGVVPEIASRSHVTLLPMVVERALKQCNCSWSDVDRLAVTIGPGLSSSLLVGMSAAKAVAVRLGKPLVGINHLEAHLYSPFLSMEPAAFDDVCPFTALIVSGGHTCIIDVEGIGRYRILGWTIDDAAGEAFDKGATLLGLKYPGGPEIERAAEGGDPGFVDFPRATQKYRKSAFSGLNPALCFSFSGVKTALLYYLRKHPEVVESSLRDIAAAYQEAIVDALVDRAERSMKGDRAFVLAGGVALNGRLREKMKAAASRRGARLLLAQPAYCGDNAAMVAGVAARKQDADVSDAMTLDAEPNLSL